MNWIYLIIAGICEIGWPVGLKFADSNSRLLWIAFAIIAMGLSGFFLFLAQRTIPMGTAYAIWTGIGAVGAFLVGIVYFKDPATMGRIFSVLLIVIGIISLKISSH